MSFIQLTLAKSQNCPFQHRVSTMHFHYKQRKSGGGIGFEKELHTGPEEWTGRLQRQGEGLGSEGGTVSKMTAYAILLLKMKMQPTGST